MIPSLGEDLVIGTDYEDFLPLLAKASQEYVTNAWWEDAPYVKAEVEERPQRLKLGRKQKREQRRYHTKSAPASIRHPHNSPRLCRRAPLSFFNAPQEAWVWVEAQPSQFPRATQDSQKQNSKQPKRKKMMFLGGFPSGEEARPARRWALKDISAFRLGAPASPFSQREDSGELGEDIGPASRNVTVVLDYSVLRTLNQSSLLTLPAQHMTYFEGSFHGDPVVTAA
ncbi:hypothetical protein NDU88_006721 [Pleurodeles waltl]|uniref:Uncharacterized protein n=1 Tax=Pleurodeles waltl TaxID=8319 RepID=A0AAV7RST6_PLEWA|nr:hypothetical protein NDU88_006721 [Pleurodeles waltl]